MSQKDNITKECTKCCEKKRVEEFWKSRAQCKECMRDTHRKWSKENKDKLVASDRRYKKKHAESIYQKVKRWRNNNPLKLALQTKRYRAKHPETVKVCKQNRRAREAFVYGKITGEQWLEVLNKYGNKCLSCQRSDIKLTMDHVLPISKGGTNTVDNVQPLCLSCNSKKHDKYMDYR